MTGTSPNTTTTILGLYELNSPYAHYNPNLTAGTPVHQSPVQVSPVPPAINALPVPLSTSPLTPREQQVFNAAISEAPLPLALEDLVPFPFSVYGDGFVSAAGSPSPAAFSSPSPFPTYTLPEELPSIKRQAQTGKTEGPVSMMPRSPAVNQYH